MTVLKSLIRAEMLIFLVSALLFYSVFILSGSLTFSKSEIHEPKKNSKRGREEEGEDISSEIIFLSLDQSLSKSDIHRSFHCIGHRRFLSRRQVLFLGAQQMKLVASCTISSFSYLPPFLETGLFRTAAMAHIAVTFFLLIKQDRFFPEDLGHAHKENGRRVRAFSLRGGQRVLLA